MTLTSLYMSDEMLERLKTESERTGAPKSELIRRAVDTYLADRESEARPRRRARKPAREMETR